MRLVPTPTTRAQLLAVNTRMSAVLIGLHGRAGAGKDTLADYLVAHWAVARPGLRVARTAFADKLKQAAAVLYDIEERDRHCLMNTEDGKRSAICWPHGSLDQDTAFALARRLFDALFPGATAEQAGKLFGMANDILLAKMQTAIREHVRACHSSNLSVSVRTVLQSLGTEGFRQHVHPDFWLILATGPLPDCDVRLFTDVRFGNEMRRLLDLGGTIVHVKGRSDASVAEHASEPSESNENETECTFVVDNRTTLLHLREQAAILAATLVSQ